MEAGAAVRAARGQRRERVTDWPLIGASEYTLSHPLVVDLLTGRPVTATRGHRRPDGVTDRTANRFRRPANAPEQG